MNKKSLDLLLMLFMTSNSIILGMNSFSEDSFFIDIPL